MEVKPTHAAIALLAAITIGLSILLILAYLDGTARQTALETELNKTKIQLQSTKGELNTVRGELIEKEGEIATQNDLIEALRTDLEDKNARIADLEIELNETQNELGEAQSTLEQAEEQISDIKDETQAMAEEINQSIQWFTDNSELPTTLKVDRFVDKAEDGCIDKGVLNLGCISYLMEDQLGMEYKDDPTGDRLYSIEEILTRKGGDCEDFSLFFKALLNRFVGEDLEAEAWESGYGEYTIYEDEAENKRWYYDNAHGKLLGNLETLKPYAACYWNEIIGMRWGGHCVMMLTAADIRSSEDISDENLADAVFFEPQDGKYMGSMGDEFQTCSDGDDGCGEEAYRIVFVITDEDLYQFSGDRWNYYAGYREGVGEIIADLESINTSSEGS